MFSSRLRWNLSTNRLARLLEEKRRMEATVLDMTESNPTRVGLDYPVAEILGALAQPQVLSYEPAPRGLLAARQAIAGYYGERGAVVDPEHIHLTASTSEGYSYLFKLLADQGDAVLVPQPSYPLFDFLAALEGVELRPYELVYTHPTGWQIDFDSLERAVDGKTRAVILVNPNNPTGSFIKPRELEHLTAVCASNQLALIVDEVFNDYVLMPDEGYASSLVSVSSVPIFVMSGFSKTLALPQMKLSWIITNGPEELRAEAEERLDLIADTFLSVGTPVQQAAPTWMRLRAGVQQQILHRVRGNLDWLVHITSDSPCRLLHVDGGWYATLEIPRLASEEERVLALLDKENVLVHPGYFFDFPREAFLVLSLLPPPEVFREATKKVMARSS